MATDNSHYVFKHHPETCAPDDLWGQVKRNVGGKDVGEAQIQMIVDAVRSGLQLGPDDELLDLCCGNGALTTRLVADSRASLGVDYSEFLIEVANNHFASDRERYLLADAADYLSAEPEPQRFTNPFRQSILDRCIAAVEAAKATAARHGTQKPMVLLQGGSFAYWLIVRLARHDPDLFYLDFGQALHAWFLDVEDVGNSKWAAPFAEPIMRNGFARFYADQGIALPEVYAAYAAL